MTEPTRAVARPPIGSENNQPTWTRHSLETEVLRAVNELHRQREAAWDWWCGRLAALLFSASLAGVGYAHTPAKPLTIAGDSDD